MYDRIVDALASQEVNKNMQDKLGPDNFIELDSEIDWTLSGYIYYFLNGKIDILPGIDYIEKLINQNEESNIISLGYGIDVTKYNNGLVVKCREPINDIIDRIDIITKSDYEAKACSKKGGVKDININNFPKYENKRVVALQNYLKKYSEYKYGKNKIF